VPKDIVADKCIARAYNTFQSIIKDWKSLHTHIRRKSSFGWPPIKRMKVESRASH